jgi:hypothetical protein
MSGSERATRVACALLAHCGLMRPWDRRPQSRSFRLVGHEESLVWQELRKTSCIPPRLLPNGACTREKVEPIRVSALPAPVGQLAFEFLTKGVVRYETRFIWDPFWGGTCLVMVANSPMLQSVERVECGGCLASRRSDETTAAIGLQR